MIHTTSIHLSFDMNFIASSALFGMEIHQWMLVAILLIGSHCFHITTTTAGQSSWFALLVSEVVDDRIDDACDMTMREKAKRRYYESDDER